jgi:hypothetical protein
MKRSLKNYWLMVVVFFGINQAAGAQTLKEIFSSSETPLLYLGVDYTQARLIDDATADVTAIRDRHYAAINDLVVNEPKKFDLNGAFHKTSVEHDLGLVAKRNAKINTEEILSTSSADYSRLKEDDIVKLVKGFDFGGKKGAGLLFIVEGMSKAKKGAAIWVTFIDMANKKVLMTERMEGKPTGIGFRNYWAYPVYDMLKSIEKKKYSEWKTKYGG